MINSPGHGWGMSFRKKRASAILIVLCLLFFAFFQPVAAMRDVRVAFQNIPPSVYPDDQGKPTGVFVEIIQDIAAKEGWSLIWVPGTLSESWERLAEGRIDLLMSVADTPERQNLYDFNREPAISVWSQIYTPPGSGINTILDLDGKRVAMLKGDMNGVAFRDYARKFDIEPTYVEFNTLDEVFSETAAGKAEAVVAFNVAGKGSADKYGLSSTNIMFNPTALGFAVPDGKNHDLVAAIDRYLAAGKGDPSSTYSQIMQRWFGMKASWTVPIFLWWGLGTAAGLVALFVIMSVVLRREVRRKTAELSRQNTVLTQKNEELQAAYEEMTTIEEELRSNYLDLERSEKALTQARKKLNVLNTLTFQEVQNGIFSLTGFIHLAKDAGCSGNGTIYLEKGREILRSIEDSLRFAKHYQEMGISQPKWQDVAFSFINAISHLDVSRISRVVDIAGLEIYADPLLENVFLNLMENVIQHGAGANSITLTSRRQNGGLTILFEDNGPGIPATEKGKIFERGYSKKQGSGLFLAREILSITGISIHETGEEGKGARFEIFVPGGLYRFTSDEPA